MVVLQKLCSRGVLCLRVSDATHGTPPHKSNTKVLPLFHDCSMSCQPAREAEFLWGALSQSFIRYTHIRLLSSLMPCAEYFWTCCLVCWPRFAGKGWQLDDLFEQCFFAKQLQTGCRPDLDQFQSRPVKDQLWTSRRPAPLDIRSEALVDYLQTGISFASRCEVARRLWNNSVFRTSQHIFLLSSCCRSVQIYFLARGGSFGCQCCCRLASL